MNEWKVSEYTDTTMSKLHMNFNCPFARLFSDGINQQWLQVSVISWDNVLINQNSSYLHTQIFSYWKFFTGNLYAIETNSCTALIIWQWKWDFDRETTEVVVICTVLIQFYPLGY
jgi:hypothetical protein